MGTRSLPRHNATAHPLWSIPSRWLDRAPFGRIAGRRLQGRREHHRATRHDLRPVAPDQKLPAVLGVVRHRRCVVPHLHLQRDLAAGREGALNDRVRAAGALGRQVALDGHRRPQLPLDKLMNL